MLNARVSDPNLAATLQASQHAGPRRTIRLAPSAVILQVRRVLKPSLQLSQSTVKSLCLALYISVATHKHQMCQGACAAFCSFSFSFSEELAVRRVDLARFRCK
ncbi:hypothetical protein FIBSPDRAFT_107382 [Athelia psychrophila]|uniref:Uncharacterized protein n=1 Tax=Athelia psychrophila TaxID=1759441 RepID=A0A166D6N5_9AGAM|nr:hypothetical protein FIBSPDRAFT_107382 [Fibularhizoctonia sp. CBS 109695]